jgi:hypothetical protein
MAIKNTARLAVVAVIAMILLLSFYLGEHSARYNYVKSYLQASPALHSTIGDVRKLHLISLSGGTVGSVTLNKPLYQTASAGVVAFGSRGRANICVTMRKYDRGWHVTLLYINGSVISDDRVDAPDDACLNKVSHVAFPFGG